MKEKATVRFLNNQADFVQTLRQRVDNYFKENQVAKSANYLMVLKTVAMLSMYLVPYFLILFAGLPHWAMFLLTLVMGVGMAGIGMSVMHDGNHGSYSTSPLLNKLLGATIVMLGGTSENWKFQHNVLHHTYTNIYDMDGDLEGANIVRLSPHAKLNAFNKYQHIYVLFVYGLITLSWVTFKDFRQLIMFSNKGLYTDRAHLIKGLLGVLFTKIVYYTYILVIPSMLIDFAWWEFLVAFFFMHYTAGMILSLVFQMAHVVEGVKQPLPDENGNIENAWAVHQLYTTANFARKNKLISWYVGGLNYQIEHHIFPNICHIHYTKISDIVKKTAEEFKLPYMEQPTFISAIVSHFRLLKELGHNQTVAETTM